MISTLVATAVGTTPSVVLQTIDLDYRVYGANDIQMGFAVVLAVAVILLSSLFIRFFSSRILDEEESEHATKTSQGLRSRDWFKIRIPHDDDVDAYREQIRAAFDGDFDSDVPSTRAALGELRRVWRERRQAATSAVRDELPALSRALSLDAVLYLLAGLVVHVSLQTWGSALTTSSKPPAPAVVIDRLVTTATSAGKAVLEVVSSFPFAGELWAFAFIAIMQAGKFVYDEVVIVGTVLLLGSIVIWFLDRAVANDVEPRLYRSRPRAAFGVAAVVVSTWFAGVTVAFVARGIHSTIGGFATGLLVAGFVVVVIGLRYIQPHAEKFGDELDSWNERRRRAKQTREEVEEAVSNAVYLSRESGFSTFHNQEQNDGTSFVWEFPIRRLAFGVIAGFVVFAIGFGAGLGTMSVNAGFFGAATGLLASLPVLGIMARRELRSSYDRLTAAYEQADDSGVGPKGTVAYIATRKFFGVLGVFAAAVLPFFVLEAVSSGKIVAIAEIALVDSSIQVKATFAFVVFALVGFVIVQTRPAWGDLATALRTGLDRNGLRIALLSRGFPVLVTVLAFPMLYGSGFFGLVESLTIAIGLALAVKVFMWLRTRAELAYYRLDRDERKPSRVWVEGVIVEDARGREIGVLKTNGKAIAAPLEPVDDERGDLPVGGVDELVDQGVADTKALFERVEREPSVYRYYFDRIQEGVVDFAAVRREYLGTISRAIDAEIENSGRDGIELERLDERMTERYDADLYRMKRRQKQKKPDGIAIYDDRVKTN